MSETDDTDDLLLIPPDFFLVSSEPEPPYYTIVNSLIKQVGNLKDRIETIETTSDISLVGSYLDHTLDCSEINIMYYPRKYSSSEEINSTQSTPQKPRTKFKLNSLPASPNIDKFSSRKSPLTYSSHKNNKHDHGRLTEADTFISNVKTIQRNSTARNLQNEFETVKSNDKDMKNVFEELDKQSKINENLRTSEESGIIMASTWKCGDDSRSVPDYSLGARNLLYKPQEEPIVPVYQPASRESRFAYPGGDIHKTERNIEQNRENKRLADQKPQRENFEATQNGKSETRRYESDNRHLFKPLSSAEITSYTSCDRAESDSSSDSTQMTAYNKLPQNRQDLVHSPLHMNALNALNMHKQTLKSTQNKTPKKRGINTMSDRFGLLNLADIWGAGNQSPSKMVQKLEEEKIKRQHCEKLISDLQNKNLELQQKLAVAVKVDDSKNKTIEQFREALEKASATADELSQEKRVWDQELSKIRSNHAAEMENATQRANYYEKEMSKALNLAHGNQDKISSLEKKCIDLQNDLQNIEGKFKQIADNYQREVDKNKRMSEIITQKEIELNENKIILNDTRAEIASSKKAVEECQKEFSSLKEECARLQNDLKQEHALTTSLSENKKRLDQEIQLHKNREKSLRDLIEETRNKLESTKIELRNFYQGQLELIVETKRKEMQTQLDQERQKYEDEFKRKEMSIAKTAAGHIKEISEKCALEIKLLEEKHREEMRLCQTQVKQSKKEIEHLQQKLAHLPEKRAQIAKELQKVMESQWNEALRMIGDTPTSFNQNQQRLERQNTYTKMDQLVLGHSSKEEANSELEETPVSSRGGGALKTSESEIQKYINMLLLRPPGNPTGGGPSANYSECPDSEQWHSGNLENLNNSQESDKGNIKQKRTDKPPWK